MVGKAQKKPTLRSWGAQKSPWIYHLNCGSCNGCDIELLTALAPRFDSERLGVLLKGSPRHADIICITGVVNQKNKDIVLNVIKQVPEPKKIMALGSCASSLGVFIGGERIAGPIDKFVKMDMYVPGCPVRPQSIINAIKKLSGT